MIYIYGKTNIYFLDENHSQLGYLRDTLRLKHVLSAMT
jgi:hypothetical protein